MTQALWAPGCDKMGGRMERGAAIYVAGGHSFVGAAILRELERQRYSRIVGGAGRREPDLTDAAQVEEFFARSAPEYVFMVAGKSGGILANQRYPAELMLDNLLATCHVVHSSYRHGATKLLCLASSCSYPKHCPQPMRVGSLWTGPLEPTNQAYATAKLAGIGLCQAYRQQYGVNCIVAIPANVFGPGDDFSAEDSHVIPAMIRKMHEAKRLGSESIELWGTGTARREFLFVDDLADACLFLMDRYDGAEPINVGGGVGISIVELAALIKEVVGYRGSIAFDLSKPDGMPVKVLDSTRLGELGWRSKVPLREALQVTYDYFLMHVADSDPLISVNLSGAGWQYGES